MRFEHLLHVYWLKGFLYGGDVVPFEVPLKKLFSEFDGIADHAFRNLIQKLELSTQLKTRPLCSNLPESKTRSINVYLARIASVNDPFTSFAQAANVRYYLVKAYRGRCQAIGKPARGQRTWSNANNAFKLTNSIRAYISKFKKSHVKVEYIKKINYKITQQKRRKTPTKFRAKVIKKPATLWL
jgi:ribosomal protein S13